MLYFVPTWQQVDVQCRALYPREMTLVEDVAHHMGSIHLTLLSYDSRSLCCRVLNSRKPAHLKEVPQHLNSTNLGLGEMAVDKGRL